MKGPAVLSVVFKQTGSQQFEGDSYSPLASMCGTFLGYCVQPWAPLDGKLMGVLVSISMPVWGQGHVMCEERLRELDVFSLRSRRQSCITACR